MTQEKDKVKKEERQETVSNTENVEELKSQLEAKGKEAHEYYENWLRAMAELDNLRKRTEKERSEYFKFANEQLIKELLPVIDNLERAVEHAQDSKDTKNLLEGINLTLKMLHSCLEKFGVKPVNAVGEKFNPHFHEAVQVEEKDEVTDEIVIKEYQKGYLLHERLLRPALVVVAKPKQKN
ncbi:MAG: nucleotide exchange factor GrpE [Candidatus Desulfofervidaceae bacterium]|nr:nucleotide exchange factor GrpE [Candidatus Desulfofervidaceae bacterium]